LVEHKDESFSTTGLTLQLSEKDTQPQGKSCVLKSGCLIQESIFFNNRVDILLF